MDRAPDMTDATGPSMSSERAAERSGRMPGDARGSTPKGDSMPGAGMRAAPEEPSEAGGAGAAPGDAMPRSDMNRDDGGQGRAEGSDTQQPARRTCGTMEEHRRLLSVDPNYARMRDLIEIEALAVRTGARTVQRPGITRIPVVVHIVWNTAAQNLSDAQITSQMDVLNRDFRRTNPDVNGTPAVFLPLTADARIEFFLATVDPNGNPTTGITRTQTAAASFAQAGNPIKSAATGGADPWPSDTYLNMWVGPRLTSPQGDLLGYAQFPGGPAATDGVVILHSAFGTIGTAAPPFHLGRTATHEIGHWLNLNHIWGDDGTGCSGTDNVDDTPNQGGFNSGIPNFPRVSCNNGPNGDMFMNYMDYTDDAGMFMFTAGQVQRMQACLDGPRSSIGVAAGAPRTCSAPVVGWGANRLDVFVLGTDRAL
jgi:hypothetical protein